MTRAHHVSALHSALEAAVTRPGADTLRALQEARWELYQHDFLSALANGGVVVTVPNDVTEKANG